MHFDTWSDFWAMGGYASYVWGGFAYAPFSSIIHTLGQAIHRCTDIFNIHLNITHSKVCDIFWVLLAC